MKKYLITGGTGFIGSALVKKLSEEKNFLRVFDNEFRGLKNTLKDIRNIEYIKGDIRNFNDVDIACKQVDSIIHLAFINGTKYFYEKPDLVLDVGVKGIVNIIDAAAKNNVKELFLASSSEVYQNPPIIPTPEDVPFSIPDPLNPRFSYAGGKIISELMALHVASKYLKKVVIFRPHNVFGPNMGYEHVVPELITKIIKKRGSKNPIIKIQGDGKATRAFIFIDDFIDALKILIEKGKNKTIYNIGTDNEVSINFLVDNLKKISGINFDTAKSDSPEGSAARRCPDITRLKKLGFIPKNSFYDGLKKTYLWYNNKQNEAK